MDFRPFRRRDGCRHPTWMRVGEDESVSIGTATTHASLRDRPPFEVASRRRRIFAPSGTRLVIASLGALLFVRFFSEGIDVLPRSSTFIDIPIFILLVLVAATRGRSVRPSATYFGLGLAFLTIAVMSSVANPSRVAQGPVLVFLYGFLAPLGIYFAVYRLWKPGNAYTVSRLLLVVGVAQFLVV